MSEIIAIRYSIIAIKMLNMRRKIALSSRACVDNVDDANQDVEEGETDVQNNERIFNIEEIANVGDIIIVKKMRIPINII
jgi:hypothetical protein